MDNDKSIEIFESFDQFEMQRIADFLAEHDIGCVINRPKAQELGIGSAYGIPNPSMGNYKLIVLEKNGKEALRLIQELLPDPGEIETQGMELQEDQMPEEMLPQEEDDDTLPRKQFAGTPGVLFFIFGGLFLILEFFIHPPPLFVNLSFLFSAILNLIKGVNSRKNLYFILAILSVGALIYVNII